ncbi:hypothetical protein AcV5_004923 [Taiwanofungus camphoratus]|nr:hypothetical protein AcW2_000484 [Antrodia cinnamomea]KAI0936897.1 hypothetical protein AcV5_004923 [Antrodia cinnamomea]
MTPLGVQRLSMPQISFELFRSLHEEADGQGRICNMECHPMVPRKMCSDHAQRVLLQVLGLRPPQTFSHRLDTRLITHTTELAQSNHPSGIVLRYMQSFLSTTGVRELAGNLTMNGPGRGG